MIYFYDIFYCNKMDEYENYECKDNSPPPIESIDDAFDYYHKYINSLNIYTYTKPKKIKKIKKVINPLIKTLSNKQSLEQLMNNHIRYLNSLDPMRNM
jgi:hypothetical protein